MLIFFFTTKKKKKKKGRFKRRRLFFLTNFHITTVSLVIRQNKHKVKWLIHKRVILFLSPSRGRVRALETRDLAQASIAGQAL